MTIRPEARGPFRRLTVDAHFNAIVENRILVEWSLNRHFDNPGPYKFTLFRGFAANDDNFVPVAETVDQPWLYDNTPARPSKGTDVFYRVTLEDGNGDVFTSQAVSAGTNWERYDWTLAREIIRKESLLLAKRTGTDGFLLKRRVFGDRCSCTDPETLRTVDPDCDQCFGTGILGGYYDPIRYPVSMNPVQRIKKLNQDTGLQSQIIETVRALAHPRPSQNDVWVHRFTDQRYIVQPDIAAIARHRGVDLILNLRLEERARSESIYNIPVPC